MFFGLIKATSQTQMMIHKPLVLSSLVVFFTTCVYSLYHKTSNDQFHGPCFSNDINDYKYDNISFASFHHTKGWLVEMFFWIDQSHQPDSNDDTQPLKGSPALCHVKTCSGKMGKPFLCIPSFWFQCRPTATTQKAGFNLSTHYEIGDWASICHPFAFLDASPGVSMGHFGIVCGCLYDFQVLPL